MSIDTGTVYGNRYVLTDRIAAGGMGEVWKATDQVLGRTVAIKLLMSGLADQPGFQQRFREEARHTAALSHANIAAVYDYGEDNGAAWLVMEYVNGEPLSQILAEEGAQSVAGTVSIIAQAADALQSAHDAGVIHRDVKPANILVRPDGVVKLTDFGIARAVDAVPLTRTGEVMGTAQYISPEQAMGHPVSPASDIYSLGCVAHEMLCGFRPFDEGTAVATAMAHVNNPPPPLPSGVPPHVADTIFACLAKEPAHRPPSGRALAAALHDPHAATTGSFHGTRMLPHPAATEMLPGADRYVGPATGAGHYQEPPAERRGSMAKWLIPLVALVLIGSGFVINTIVNSNRGTDTRPGDTPPAPTSAAVSTSPSPSVTATSESPPDNTTPNTTPGDTVTVDSNEFIGKDVATVERLLRSRGLLTRRIGQYDSRQYGEVILVNPAGSVRRGETITITYSKGRQPAPTTTTTTTSGPKPTTTTPAPTTTTPTNPATTGNPTGTQPALGTSRP